jgi:hypothetical protein
LSENAIPVNHLNRNGYPYVRANQKNVIGHWLEGASQFLGNDPTVGAGLPFWQVSYAGTDDKCHNRVDDNFHYRDFSSGIKISLHNLIRISAYRYRWSTTKLKNYRTIELLPAGLRKPHEK